MGRAKRAREDDSEDRLGGGRKRASLDTADFFAKDAFSDIVIKFSGREVKAHKIILCSKSEYFRKAFGPDSKFLESQQASYELREDDADAVEAMLRYLYRGDYPIRRKGGEFMRWEHHLNLAVVADKYGIPALTKLAASRLTNAGYHDLEPSADLANLIAQSYDCPGIGKNSQKMNALIEKHFVTLFEYPVFRAFVDEIPAMKVPLFSIHFRDLQDHPEFVKSLQEDGETAFEILKWWSVFTSLGSRYIEKCEICDRSFILDLSTFPESRECKYCDGTAGT